MKTAPERPRPSPPDVAWPKVFRLAAPAVVDGFLAMTVGVIGLLLVGRLGDAALAGMGAALQLVWFAISLGAALGTGTTVSVAHAIGRGDREGARTVVVQAVVLALAASVVVACLAPFSTDLVAVLGGDREVTERGADYVRVSLVGAVVLILPAVLSGALRGVGDTRTPMLAGIATNVVNLALTPLLVFGVSGVPAHGVEGAAWGATVARAIGGLVMVAALLRSDHVIGLPWQSGMRHRWLPDLGAIRRLTSLSLPTAVEQFQATTAMLIFGMLVLAEGTAISAAQRVVFNLMGVAYLPAIGCATAATILVGQSYGAGVPWPGGPAAVRATERSFVLALGWLVSMGSLFVAFAPFLVGLYTTEPAVLEAGVPGLRIIGVFLPVATISIVFGSALRGAGDTRSPMTISSITMWLVTLPTAWFAGNVLGAGLPGLFGAFFVGGFASGCGAWWRWRRTVRALGIGVRPAALGATA